MTDTIFDQWRKDGRGLSYEEFLDACPHWEAKDLTVMRPLADGRIPFAQAARVRGNCPTCGKHLDEMYGNFLEARLKRSKEEGWKRCLMSGGLVQSLAQTLGRKYECDCQHCREQVVRV